MSNNKPTNAFVLRQSPCGKSQLEAISLPENVIVNGWAEARCLHELGDDEYYKCRDIIKNACYASDASMRKAGYAAGTMWRFLKEMKIGDWVVVPHWGGLFYVAEVTGNAYYDTSAKAVEAQSCYRRSVNWLNNGQAVERKHARSRLISRMKTQQTSADAQDLIDDIHAALSLAREYSGGQTPAAAGHFRNELRAKMIQTTLAEIQTGHMDERGFEQLVAQVVQSLGASNVKIVSRRNDKGVDIRATFNLGPVQQTVVGIQVKYYKGEMENNWPIDQLFQGLEDEGLALGWLVTSGMFQESAEEYLKAKLEGSSRQIQLIDGELLSGMIVDMGLQQVASAKYEH